MPARSRPHLPARTARRTALPLVLGASLSACGASVDPEPSGRAPVVVAPSLPSVASGVTQVGVPKLVNVGLSKGVVTGARGTVRMARNTPVRLTVLTDTSQTLLVEGYALRAQLTVDEPVQLAFIADRKGTFRVVLEPSGTLLTQLRVD